MPTQLQWQSQVERRVAAIAQSTDAPEPVRHMPLHSSGWTQRDQLLSDALHAFDVAQGADRTQLGVKIDLFDLAPPSEEHDDAFLAHYKAEGGFFSHIAHERAVETWQKRNDPPLTSDANKTHDPSPDARRWVNGQACMEAIDLEHEADVAITVEPLREDLARIDALIEDNRNAWVDDLLDERDEIVRDILIAEEGGKVHPLPDKGRSGKRACPNSFVKRSGEASVDEALTVPTAERLRSYALTFLAQRYGSTSTRFNVESALREDTGWTSRAVAEHVEDDLHALAERNRVRRGLKQVSLRDGRTITVRPKATAGKSANVKALTTYRLRDRPLTGTPQQIRVKAANRDLMPLQRPVHTGAKAHLAAWEYSLVTRIAAGFRMVAYKRGVYVPTSPRKTRGPQSRFVSPVQDTLRYSLTSKTSR